MPRALWLLALAAALAAGAPAVTADPGRVPLPVLEVDRTTTCVAPPDVMRREHPRMLERRKDLTVRYGVRGGKEALTSCIECHADRQTRAVVSTPQAFCQACHDYVAVRLNCFECHQGRLGAVRSGEVRSGAVELGDLSRWLR